MEMRVEGVRFPIPSDLQRARPSGNVLLEGFPAQHSMPRFVHLLYSVFERINRAISDCNSPKGRVLFVEILYQGQSVAHLCKSSEAQPPLARRARAISAEHSRRNERFPAIRAILHFYEFATFQHIIPPFPESCFNHFVSYRDIIGFFLSPLDKRIIM